MNQTRLIPLSRISSVPADTVRAQRRREPDGRATEVLMQARSCWDAMFEFRRSRDRAKRYTYGDQWGDVIHTEEGDMVESEYIRRNGSLPLKNNLIRRLVRNVTGVYRGQNKEPVCTARDREEQGLGETMSTVLQYNWQLNRMADVNARCFEEFLISGFVAQRKSFGWRDGKSECWTDIVQPDNFIIDSSCRDIRGWDCTLVGEIHDIPFSTLCREFADTRSRLEWLRDTYGAASNRDYLASYVNQFGMSHEQLSFFWPSDHNLCRVIEVWTKESKPRYRCHDYLTGSYYKIDECDYESEVEAVNAARLLQGREQGLPDGEVPLIVAEWFMDDYWYYRYLTPFGDVLREGETPYDHGGHPYVFRMFPFIDGEIHSFVEDVIDQQKYVNRLIMLYDWIMRSSAKGVLVFPERCLSDKMKIEDVARQWARFDGLIVVDPKPGAEMPRQLVTNATNIGIDGLLELQLKFFEDISGVHGALQGKPGFSGQSAALYSQQTQNAANTLLDLLDTFSGFVTDSAVKDVKNIQQFYDSRRVVAIAGRSGSVVEYDPEKVRNVEFDLSINESASTPVYRQLANDTLMQIWQSGQITLEQLLRNGNFPFADRLLQDIEATRQKMAEQQAAAGGQAAGTVTG